MLSDWQIKHKGLHRASLFHLVLLSSLMAGCSSVVAPEVASIPSLPLPSHFDSYGHWQAVKSQTTEQATPANWSSLPYPDLVSLLNKLPEQNANLSSLYAKYRASLASLSQAEASRYPNSSLSASRATGTAAGSNSLTSSGLPTGDVYTLGMSLNWELDIWGKIDQQMTEQTALVKASESDWQTAILSIQVLAGQTYFHLKALARHLQLLQQIMQEQSRFIHLTQARHRAGIATALDIAQAQTQYHNSHKQRLELQAEYAQKRYALATLLGQQVSSDQPFYPLNQLLEEHPNQQQTAYPLAPIPHLIPSERLLHRPDVQAALGRVIAANARVGYSKTAFLPSLSLSANINQRQRDWKDLLDLPNSIWSLGPSLALTLFDGGRRAAIMAQAQAEYDASVAQYRQTVLTAFEEIEQNLTSVLMIEQAVKVQAASIASASTALRIAQSQYRAGTVDALTVINAQTQLWQAEQGMIDLWLRHWQAYLVLIKQMGTELEIG